MWTMVLAASPPQSIAFDLVLIVHVGVALVAAVVLMTSYGAARSLSAARSGAAWPEATARYFTPGPEIAGRVLYLIPLSGAALLGMSQHAFDIGDTFVWLGLALWLVAVGAAEHLVFAAGRRLRRQIADGVVPDDGSWRADGASLCRGVEIAMALLIVAAVLMVAQP